ncbi:MAG: phosphatase PAP2-related protein [bacterium]
MIASFFVNFYAGTYATEKASGYVQDIVLSNIPVFDVDMIFIYGPLVLWVVVAGLCSYKPNRIPFILKSIALFIIIRSIFITLTHIGPFPDQIALGMSPTSWINKFTFGGDLFFSAHTGLPFLMSLIFWDNKFFRTLFFLTAVFFGIIVLLGHMHYSIDVLSAFFITYSIYHIALKFFKEDKIIFDHQVPEI